METSANHTHNHKTQTSHGRAFALAIGLNITFVIVEIIYGLVANSSSLLADAGHNASDVLGLVFAWAAAWMATIKPKGRYTYGLRKTTILVSILNALFLFGAVAVIGWNAIEKLRNPEPVLGTQIMIVAAVGVVINTFTALLFIKGQKNDLNIKGAFLHMAADAGVSLGVVVAGLLIKLTGLQWIDSLTSFVILFVIIWGTWKLFSASIDLALDAVPKHINVQKVKDFLNNKTCVESIHDLHIWALSTSEVALSVHLYMPQGTTNTFLSELQEEIEHEFGIKHITIQIENDKINCKTIC
ncbi:MAG: cation diffusion facilitator family transporter, partial [Bacteroidales bacterium]|nr:cation diffusion facilitator family transporter [Bacteroidales bacterium]MDD4209998.1 cation diffusion facilitator family transporter [Bacteroidales bacterium]